MGGGSQGIPDRFEHHVLILEDGTVPEPQDPEPLQVQPSRSRGILLNLSGVLTPIEFHDQAPFEADEIDDVGTDRCLPTEPAAVELAVPQVMPELPFGLRHRLAEMAGEVAAHRLSPHPGHPPHGTFRGR
ncbi:MAG TPA: hypothetical protein VF590_20760, partial [Isosphaeraceae bacterium]